MHQIYLATYMAKTRLSPFSSKRKLLCIRPPTHLSQGNGKSKSLGLLTPYISLKVRPSTVVAQVPITCSYLFLPFSASVVFIPDKSN